MQRWKATAIGLASLVASMTSHAQAQEVGDTTWLKHTSCITYTTILEGPGLRKKDDIDGFSVLARIDSTEYRIPRQAFDDDVMDYRVFFTDSIGGEQELWFINTKTVEHSTNYVGEPITKLRVAGAGRGLRPYFRTFFKKLGWATGLFGSVSQDVRDYKRLFNRAKQLGSGDSYDVPCTRVHEFEMSPKEEISIVSSNTRDDEVLSLRGGEEPPYKEE